MQTQDEFKNERNRSEEMKAEGNIKKNIYKPRNKLKKSENDDKRDMKAAPMSTPESQINRIYDLLIGTLNFSRGRKESSKRENDWLERKVASMEKRAKKGLHKTTW